MITKEFTDKFALEKFDSTSVYIDARNVSGFQIPSYGRYDIFITDKYGYNFVTYVFSDSGAYKKLQCFNNKKFRLPVFSKFELIDLLQYYEYAVYENNTDKEIFVFAKSKEVYKSAIEDLRKGKCKKILVTEKVKDDIKRIIDNMHAQNTLSNKESKSDVIGRVPSAIKRAGLYAYIHIDPQSKIPEIRFPHNSPYRSDLMNKKLIITVSPQDNGIIIETHDINSEIYGYFSFNSGSIFVENLNKFIELEYGIKYYAFVEKINNNTIALILHDKPKYLISSKTVIINPKTKRWDAKIKLKSKNIIVLLNKELIKDNIPLDEYGYWYEIFDGGLKLIGTKSMISSGVAEDHGKYIEIVLTADPDDIKLLGNTNDEIDAKFSIKQIERFGNRPEIIITT